MFTDNKLTPEQRSLLFKLDEWLTALVADGIAQISLNGLKLDILMASLTVNDILYNISGREFEYSVTTKIELNRIRWYYINRNKLTKFRHAH